MLIGETPATIEHPPPPPLLVEGGGFKTVTLASLEYNDSSVVL
jgi:hypothetical protein